MEILASLCKLNVKHSVTKSWKFLVTHFKIDTIEYW